MIWYYGNDGLSPQGIMTRTNSKLFILQNDLKKAYNEEDSMNSNTQEVNKSLKLPILYSELAEWWPLLSAPEEYAEEASFYYQTLISACHLEPKTMLELGSGGGNNASHLKKYFQMTLVDLSRQMLSVSQKLNPECKHIHGDMRSVRLGELFDTVFINDAIVYMTTKDDLSLTIKNAFDHCRIGGAALFVPDFTRETFVANTEHGGHDQGERGVRYLSWTWDPDLKDSSYVSYMVYLLKEGKKEIGCFTDTHICGLFSDADWMEIMKKAGFSPLCIPFHHSQVETGEIHVFLGKK